VNRGGRVLSNIGGKHLHDGPVVSNRIKGDSFESVNCTKADLNVLLFSV
jgi:hypothetical protein